MNFADLDEDIGHNRADTPGASADNFLNPNKGNKRKTNLKRRAGKFKTYKVMDPGDGNNKDEDVNRKKSKRMTPNLKRRKRLTRKSKRISNIEGKLLTEKLKMKSEFEKHFKDSMGLINRKLDKVDDSLQEFSRYADVIFSITFISIFQKK